MQEKKEKTCCFTGHRSMPREERSRLQLALKMQISAMAEKGITMFYCGGALGFDTLAAEAVLQVKKEYSAIRLHLALPCPEQADRWRKEDMARYEKIKAQADEVVFVSPRYDYGCMQKRNRYMVDRSSVCIAYLLPEQKRGGTQYTVAYCGKKHIPVINLAEEK